MLLLGNACLPDTLFETIVFQLTNNYEQKNPSAMQCIAMSKEKYQTLYAPSIKPSTIGLNLTMMQGLLAYAKIKDKHQVLLDRHKKYVDSTQDVGNIRHADAVAILIQMKVTDSQPSTIADRMQTIHHHQSYFLGKRVYNGRNDTSNGASSSKYQRKLSSAEINDLKAKTKCRICRKKRHWGGDSECEFDVNGAQKGSTRTPQ